jgi:RNA polymerase-binding transcription factor DksA
MSLMTPDRLDQFRELLVKERETLTARLRASLESAHPGQAEASQVQQAAKAQRRRDEGAVQMIGSALGRIRAGTYGECLKCEEPIELSRLEDAPEAPLCKECRAQNALR